MDFHTKKCVFLGYSLLHKWYKRLGKNGKVYILASVNFDEFDFPFHTDFDLDFGASSTETSLNILNPMLSMHMPFLSLFTTTLSISRVP